MVLTGCTSPQPLTRRQQPFQSPFRLNARPAPVEIVCTSNTGTLRLVDLVRVQSRTPVPPCTALHCAALWRGETGRRRVLPTRQPRLSLFLSLFLSLSLSLTLSLFHFHLTSPHSRPVSVPLLALLHQEGRTGRNLDRFIRSFIHSPNACPSIYPPRLPDKTKQPKYPVCLSVR